MNRSFLVLSLAGSLVAIAFAPSTLSADHIPDIVSQHSHRTSAGAEWRFDEPNGFSRLVVGLQEDFVVAPRGLKHREKFACVSISHLDSTKPDNRLQEFSGCKPLAKGEHGFDPRLADAYLKITIAVQCTTLNCDVVPAAVHVDLSWTAGGPLIVTSGVNRNEECHFHRRDEGRDDVVARGSVTDGLTEYTRGEAGAGTIGSSIRTALIVGEPTDCS